MRTDPQASSKPPAFRHLVVCANPSPSSFDHSVVEAYASVARAHGHVVDVRDLYQIGFDPVLKLEERPGHGEPPAPDVAVELDFLRAADALILVYPIWYGLPPAILKGYVDRVLGANYSYRDFHDQRGQPSLAGKPLVSFSTSGLPLSWLRERGQTMSLREIIDVYLWRGFGMKQSQHVMIDSIVPNMSTAHATEQLRRVRETAEQVCASLSDEPYGAARFEA